MIAPAIPGVSHSPPTVADGCPHPPCRWREQPDPCPPRTSSLSRLPGGHHLGTLFGDGGLDLRGPGAERSDDQDEGSDQQEVAAGQHADVEPVQVAELAVAEGEL